MPLADTNIKRCYLMEDNERFLYVVPVFRVILLIAEAARKQNIEAAIEISDGGSEGRLEKLH